MEGLSTIYYKGKQIHYVDYSTTGGSKEKTLLLTKVWEEEFCKHPPKSVLTLANASGFRFDKEIMNATKAARIASEPYEIKSALFGMNNLTRAVYNFVLAMTAGNYQKVFNTELEAKEWLVSA